MNWEKERLILQNKIVNRDFSFEEFALRLFALQYQFNPSYRQYIDLIKVDPSSVKLIEEIPFLPITFFKSHEIRTGSFTSKKTFTSSGTTASTRSKHFIRDLEWYNEISQICFQDAFGINLSEVIHLGLLPSYASNPDSSLLYMLRYFMEKGGGAYFHDDPQGLSDFIEKHKDKQIFLWGVSYALLRWKERFPKTENLKIIETGGMKGREKEITRMELHEVIGKAFHIDFVSSEYGMTELLSQAYAVKKGLFHSPFSMRVFPRSISDPLAIERRNTVAALNIVDLANIDSCAFIATEDLGKVYDDGSFEVMGRLDNADIRGCNLLIG
ncbi:MAG: acyl transferase [Saprospiraceae bacterium]